MMKRKIILAVILVIAAGGIFAALNWGAKRTPDVPDIPPPPPETAPRGAAGTGQVEPPADNRIFDFTLPYKDRQTGRMLYKITGKEALPLKNKEGKITKLEIRYPVIFLYAGDGGQITISANEGHMSSSGMDESEIVSSGSSELFEKKGFLAGDVEMDTGDGMKVYVDDIHWDSGHTRMYTASPVRAVSAQFELTGTGMHTEDSFNIIDINSDVRVDIRNEGSRALGISGSPGGGSIRITCKKNLVLRRMEDAAEFNEDALAVQGEFSLSADLLRINFSKQPQGPGRSLSLDSIFASGDVAVAGPRYNAAGDELTYDASDGIAVIKGREKIARLWQKGDFVESEVIEFSPASSEISSPGAGLLSFYLPQPAGKEKSKTTITWKGNMHFYPEKNSAHFEKDVEIDDGSSTLKSQVTDIDFRRDRAADGAQNMALSKITARQDVCYIEAKRKISGDRLVFDKDRGFFTVYSRTQSEVVQGTDTLRAPEISFNTEQDVTIARGEGSLTVMPDETEGDVSPITITWQDWMKFYAEDDSAEFRKKVRMDKKNEILEAESVTVKFEKENLNRRIKNVLARENVYSRDRQKQFWCDTFDHTEGRLTKLIGSPARIESEGALLEAPLIILYPSENRLIARGSGRLYVVQKSGRDNAVPAETIILWKEKMIYEGDKSFCEFFENVNLTQKENGVAFTRLESDYLKVFFKGGAEVDIASIQEITKAVATSRRNGDVIFERRGQRGAGNHLEWEKDRDKAVLTGQPFATLFEQGRQTRARTFHFGSEKKIKAEGQQSITLWPGSE